MQVGDSIILKGGRKLGFAQYGDLKGYPIFFFHGWPSSRLQAMPYAKVAKQLHVRIISVDRPGYGISDYKKNRKMTDWPKDIADLADNLKIHTFSVLGNSGGGPYAAVCGAKLSDRVERIGISVGLAPLYVHGILVGMPLANKIGWANFGKFPWLRYVSASIISFEWRYMAWIRRFSYGAKVDREIIKGFNKEYLIANQKETFRQGIHGAVGDLKIYSHDWGFSVRQIKVPAFIWYGEDDKNVPLTMGKYYEKNIPNVKAMYYPHEGHTLILKHLSEILKTLKGT